MAFCEIKSDKMVARVGSKGAELVFLQLQGQEHNWIWSGLEPWRRSAPHLFPIVGKLAGDSYQFKNQKYHLSQHGFARDLEFEVVGQSESSLQMRLLSGAQTKTNYPFDFCLDIIYRLNHATLTIEYNVKNLGTEEMFFNIGWHPAFVLPSQKQLPISVSGNCDFPRYHHLSSGLLDMQTSFGSYIQTLNFDSAAFEKDAWVFTERMPNTLKITDVAGNAVLFKTGDAPFLGFWSKDPAKFLCVEPWWGVADLLAHNGDLKSKYGIQLLAAGEEWSTKMSVEIQVASESC